MPIDLQGVPETLLWTLYHRASDARRPDAVLADPRAVALVEAIDFPFEERFGRATAGWAQWQALRARCFDEQVARFLAEHPGGTVVALGEGLETQFWRVDDGRVRWLSVDLPEVMALRERLLPPPPRQRLIAGSALDPAWLDEVDAGGGVLVSAQGLLMYLEPDEVHRLIATVAERIPRGALVFDAVARWLSRRSMRGDLEAGAGYRPPPWSWGLDEGERRWIRGRQNVAELRTLPLPRGRGFFFGGILPVLSRSPRGRGALLSILHARLGAGRSAAPRP